MAWCHQATSHYLSQCWPRSPSPYGVTRPQWVKLKSREISFVSVLQSFWNIAQSTIVKLLYCWLRNKLGANEISRYMGLRCAGLLHGGPGLFCTMALLVSSVAVDAVWSMWWWLDCVFHALLVLARVGPWLLTHWDRNKMAAIFQTTFSNAFLIENIWIWNAIWLNFAPQVPIDNNTTLVHIMAWRRASRGLNALNSIISMT